MSSRKTQPPRPPSEDSTGFRLRAGALLEARLPVLIRLWRAGQGSRLPARDVEELSVEEIRAAGSALLSLQRGLTGDRALAGSGYMEELGLLGAYLLYYWPITYMEVSLALAEFPFSARRVLDLGSGPGPAAAAVMDAPGAGEGLEELVLLDSSRKALHLAEAILGQGPRRAKLRTVDFDLESEGALPEGPFDLIIFGHCLNELWGRAPEAQARRFGLIERAAGSLGPGGRVLLLEPAVLTTSRGLIDLRDKLAARGWQVIGPCPGSYACPALAAGPERSCHAQSPWVAPEPLASLAAAASLDRSSVKFAYFFLAPGGGREARPSSQAVERRVVSDPLLNKAGRLRYLLCAEGGLETISAPATGAAAQAKDFAGLRRGDRLNPRGLESRPGGGLGLLPESELGIVARAPEAWS